MKQITLRFSALTLMFTALIIGYHQWPAVSAQQSGACTIGYALSGGACFPACQVCGAKLAECYIVQCSQYQIGSPEWTKCASNCEPDVPCLDSACAVDLSQLQDAKLARAAQVIFNSTYSTCMLGSVHAYTSAYTVCIGNGKSQDFCCRAVATMLEDQYYHQNPLQ